MKTYPIVLSTIRRVITILFLTIFLSLVLDASFVHAGDGDFVWAKTMGGFWGSSIALDVAGNVYTTGTFNGTADFDPGPETYYLTANYGLFISKLSSTGDFIWAKAIDDIGAGSMQGPSIFVDNSGYTHITGKFRGTVDFDPGEGIFNLTSIGYSDVFVCKLDCNGNFVWAKAMGGFSEATSTSIFVDISGSVYTIGEFYGTGDFDPGRGKYYLVSAGSVDIFISKLDSSGNFVWAKAMGGAIYDVPHDISVDTLGNVYTTGKFYGTTDFDPGPGKYYLSSIGGYDIFISKLDSNGNFIWAKRMGGPSASHGYSIFVDASGSIYTTGGFRGTVDFDPGEGIYNLTSKKYNLPSGDYSYDIFVSKLSSVGNFVWAKAMSATSDNTGRSITVDLLGNVYTTGDFRDTVDFDPGLAKYNLTSTGESSDIFISKLDSSGNFVWAKAIGGPSSYDIGTSITVDTLSNVYTTGRFSGTVDFDPGAGNFNLTSKNIYNIFIVNLGGSRTDTYVPCSIYHLLLRNSK